MIGIRRKTSLISSNGIPDSKTIRKSTSKSLNLEERPFLGLEKPIPGFKKMILQIVSKVSQLANTKCSE
ncbi:MAG: hypothetical protein HY818_07665 [Acetobacterium woodii]|nr:hypothetical protein [Acetobacterium woodii]